MDGILVYKDKEWRICNENGEEALDCNKTIELEMDGGWTKSHMTICGDKLLVDQEAELSASIVNEMEIRLRQS